jgi:hypothetical protein
MIYYILPFPFFSYPYYIYRPQNIALQLEHETDATGTVVPNGLRSYFLVRLSEDLRI